MTTVCIAVMIYTVTTVQEAEELAAEALRAHLPKARVTAFRGTDEGTDILIRRPDGSSAAVEVKQVSVARHDDVIGRLATSVLRRNKSATGKRAHGAVRIGSAVVIVAPRATPGSAAALEKFAKMYAPEMGWGLIDDSGACFLELPFWNVSVRERGRSRVAAGAVSPKPALFSDLHAWILKVLLLADVDPPLWSGPRVRVTTVEQLQRECHISRMTAYRFLQTLESEDFVQRSGGAFSIVRRAELVRRWFDYVQHARFEVLHTRATFEPSRLTDLLSNARDLRWAVAGFAACRELGVLHASFTTSEVYVEDTAKALAAWHLEGCDPRDAQVVLLRTPFAESIFRAPSALGSLNVVDVLQAALDVSRHAARGLEQAQYLVHEVLGWKDVALAG